MSDTEIADNAEQEIDEIFNIPKQFLVDDIDDNMMQFVSSSDDTENEDNEQDYLSQIENNEKVQEWIEQQNKSKSKKRKHSESKDENEDNSESDSPSPANTKYAQIMEMEQSTSGLNLEDIRESQLFREFRVIGLVCNDIPFCYQKLGDSFFIGTSIGKSFQIYEGKTLRLKISGRTTKNKINAMIMDHELTFTAVGNNVEIWFRVKKVAVITKHYAKVYIIKLMGHLLITIGEDKMLYVWDIKRLLNRKFDISQVLQKSNSVMIRKPVKSIDFNAENNDFINSDDVIECIAHPPTYLNKIVIGFQSGKMQIWNINTCNCIYTMKHHKFEDDNNSLKSSRNVAITCIEPSPILDVVAIGFSNGHIAIHNIKTDKNVMRFEHHNAKTVKKGENNYSIDAVHGRINGLSFRRDGIPYLVSVGSDSNIVIWNLKKRKLENIYYNAHRGRIRSAQFIETENILVTSSTDNSLKMWLFDDDDNYGNLTGQLRLLKMRSGHSNQPHLCRFHGRKALLSTSNDNTLRVSWIQRDIQCLSMGQRSLRKQSKKRHSIPRIKSIHSTMNKSRFWSNVVTVHNNDNKVRLWNTQKFKMEETMLIPIYNDKASMANVSCAIISHCGHFVYVGRISGVIDKFNIESGRHRMQISDGHNKIIRSLFLSLFNNVLISVSSDGSIKFWNVGNVHAAKVKCQHEIRDIADANEVISRCCYDKRSNLLAVATDNLCIYLFDGANGAMIRKFNLNDIGKSKRKNNYYSNITAMIFSPRCKWLLVSTMDGSVRVYDLMSGLIIDWFKYKNAVTSMSFAVNGCFLATTHINTMGIHIWANKHHFIQSFLKNVGNEPIIMDKIDDEDENRLMNERKVAETMKNAQSLLEDEDESESESSLLDSSLDDVLDLDYQQSDEEDFELPDIASLHLKDDNELITMSANPKSVWKNLANWDSILIRNRPSMKVKKNMANIPFFIPTKLHHQHIEMDTTSFNEQLEQKQELMEEKMKKEQFEKRKKILENMTETKFKNVDAKKMDNDYNTCSRLVYFIKKEMDEKKENAEELKYEMARDYLLSLNPSASDAELHSIGINFGTAKAELMMIIKFFIFQLDTNRNFEHIQSFIALFLKIHSDLIIKHSATLNFEIVKLRKLLNEKWTKINELFQSNLCLVQFYSRLQQ